MLEVRKLLITWCASAKHFFEEILNNAIAKLYPLFVRFNGGFKSDCETHENDFKRRKKLTSRVSTEPIQRNFFCGDRLNRYERSLSKHQPSLSSNTALNSIDTKKIESTYLFNSEINEGKNSHQNLLKTSFFLKKKLPFQIDLRKLNLNLIQIPPTKRSSWNFFSLVYLLKVSEIQKCRCRPLKASLSSVLSTSRLRFDI